MNAPLIAAGVLATLGAAAHGAGGQLLVLGNLSAKDLPPTRFGGPRTTKAMIDVTWHIATVGFVTVAAALLLAGFVLDGDTAEAVALLAAGASTGFAAVAVVMGGATLSPRSVFRHPGPALLTVTAALGWWGAL